MNIKLKNVLLKTSVASMSMLAAACSQMRTIVWDEASYQFVMYMGNVRGHYRYAARHMRNTTDCVATDAALIEMLVRDEARFDTLYTEFIDNADKILAHAQHSGADLDSANLYADPRIMDAVYYSRVLGRRCSGHHMASLIYNVQARRMEIMVKKYRYPRRRVYPW